MDKERDVGDTKKGSFGLQVQAEMEMGECSAV